LEDFQSIPVIFKDEIFEQAFEKAEIAKYSEEERSDYEESLKTYRDLKGVIDTAFDEGKIEMARAMKIDAESIEKIVKYTGLTKLEIDKL
jgi:hypothetical protein